MPKPGYKEVDEARRQIVAQAFEDLRAGLGVPYHHVARFHAYVEKIYQAGVRDGRKGLTPMKKTQ